MKNLVTALLAITVTLSSAGTAARDELPAVSHDGLHLLPDTQLRAVYMRPGADLSQYDKIALLDTYVAFRKHWQRDHNRDESFAMRVSDSDMEKIRTRVAEEFAKEFTKVLSTEGGHEMVSKGGEGVLILRPAIIDLDVIAPDVMSAGISHTIVSSAGSMTLLLELYDGKTGDIIARAIDPEVLDKLGPAHVANRVTNKADFDRVVRRWAEILNDQLAEVKK